MHYDQQHRLWPPYTIGLIIRLICFFLLPGLPEFLTGRVEISTPISSFKRLQEGIFLYQTQGFDFDGGIYHQAPLLLPIFGQFPAHHFEWISKLLFTACDILSAYALERIARSGRQSRCKAYTSPRHGDSLSSSAIVAIFLLNPLTLFTCVGRSTSVFTTTSILGAVAFAVQCRALSSMAALALASHLSAYPVLLLPPLMMLNSDEIAKPAKGLGRSTYDIRTRSSIAQLFTFSAVLVLLFVVSFELLGRPTLIFESTYLVQLLLPDLTPNIGLWWYFFIEIFDSFRSFFVGVFWIHLAGYVGGLCIRIYQQPLFVITTLLGIFAIFKPYPCVGDTALYFGMLSLYKHIFPLMRYSFFASAALLYAAFMGPAFFHLWLYAGSGNANFFYAITLVWSLGLILVLVDSLFAVLRDEWETDRPEMKGKEVCQI